MFIRRAVFCLVAWFLCIGLATNAVADELSIDRARFKSMLKTIASDIEKNFYDPNLKGLDWKALQAEAITKIDNAKNLSEMIVATYVFIDKLQDSHTRYRPPARSLKLFYGFDAKAIGNEIRVYEIRKGDVAEKAGIKLGDKIISLNGFQPGRKSWDLMMFDYRGLRPRTTWDLVLQTGNEPPRNVKLEARRKQEANLLGVDTAYGDIWNEITEDQNYEQEHQDRVGSRDKGQIGYLWIREFRHDDGDALRRAMGEFSGAKAFVLDLRSNPGGDLDCLKDFMGVFEQNEVTVLDMVGRKKTEPLIVRPKSPSVATLPVYVLIDSRTGSAAEILARHLQRTGKAVIIGDNSPGRVTISRMFANTYGAENAVPFGAQIGIARALFPDGLELEKVGVKPDVYCIPTGDDMRNENDVCFGKALAMAREKLGIKQAEGERQ